MFESCKIKGFRGITELAVDDLKRVNVFVGKNNCGKTSILEGLYLGMCMPSASAPQTLLRLREVKKESDLFFWNLIFNKMDISQQSTIILNHQDQDKTRTLNISYQPNMNKNKIGWHIEINNNSYTSHYDFYEGEGRDTPFAGAQPPNHANMVQRVNILTTKDAITMMRGHFDRVKENGQLDGVVEILKRIEPSLTGLEWKENFIQCNIGLDKLMPLNFMGDGMVRTLAVALAVADSAGGCALIDEIENGLHYSSLGIMWKAVLGLAEKFGVQVFATTHSYEALQALAEIADNSDDAIRVFRIERKDDQYKAVVYDREILSVSVERNLEVR